MKKLILVVFITFTFSVPCIAEGIKPNGLFGLHGTLWALPMPQRAHILHEAIHFAFYDGTLYTVADSECVFLPSSSYTDFLFFSVFQVEYEDTVANGLLSSLLGIGCVTGYLTGERLQLLLKKESDGWMPPEDCEVLESSK